LYCRGSYSFEIFFPLGTDFNATSLISLPMDISGEETQFQNKKTHNGVRTSAVYEIRLQNFVLLLL
jgi:hypothetical protein